MPPTWSTSMASVAIVGAPVSGLIIPPAGMEAMQPCGPSSDVTMPNRPRGVFSGCDIAVQRDGSAVDIYPLGVYDGDMTELDHTQHQTHAEHAGHAGHGDHGGHGHGDHVAAFRRLFWVMLVLAVPTVALSGMFAMILGYTLPAFPARSGCRRCWVR